MIMSHTDYRVSTNCISCPKTCLTAPSPLTNSNKYSLRTHMHLNHKDQLHLIGSGKKSKKQVAPSTPAATTAKTATPSYVKIAPKVEKEQFYAV